MKLQIAVFSLVVTTGLGLVIIFGGGLACSACDNGLISAMKQLTVYNGIAWIVSIVLTILWRGEK